MAISKIKSDSIDTVATTKLTGTVTDAQIAAVAATKLTGSIADARIPASAVTQHASDYIDWQAVVTAATLTAVAGRGYLVNTTSNACTVTFPAAASAGDTIKLVDYLRTWGTNAVTINQNSLKFQGWATPNPVFDTDGQAVTFTYVDATQGWLVLVDDDVPYLTAQSIQATGGTLATYTYDSVDYKVHKITSSGSTNFVIAAVPSGKTIDVLVVAGGGGGSPGVHSAANGGGGGAGGLRWFTAQTPTASTYTAIVGAGGAGANAAQSASGTDSSFIGTGISITANGGGAGGYNNANNALTGGSGGGSSGTNAGAAGNEGSFTPVEGYGGGTSNTGSAGGGGGGSGGVGSANVGEPGTTAHGGVGEDNFLNQSSAAFTVAATKALLDAVSLGEVSGSSRYIAGGGGGGGAGLTNGGLGGGGDGQASFGTGTAGTVNTGSGGGGGAHSATNNTSGSGGSGVILVRYLA
jgi:hypothetical protein